MPHSSDPVTRRAFLGVAAGVAATLGAGGQTVSPIPIIDTHIHLFDPTRPQGAPYSGPRVPGVAPVASLPDRYRQLAAPLGIVGAIKVEASPWIEDNLWALQVAQTDPIIVGVIGNLEPEKAEFREYLERYGKNPLFRGIRCGNLWGRNFAAQSGNPEFLAGLAQLADADLVMDTANPRADLLEAVIRITDKVPNLRVVIDHLPGYDPVPADQARHDTMLREISARPQIYLKISQVIHRMNGKVSTDLSAYRSRLDVLAGLVGEDRVIFGSDWPNSDGVTTLDKIVLLARDYLSTKSHDAATKFFWKNSAIAYRWKPRDRSQPGG